MPFTITIHEVEVDSVDSHSYYDFDSDRGYVEILTKFSHAEIDVAVTKVWEQFDETQCDSYGCDHPIGWGLGDEDQGVFSPFWVVSDGDQTKNLCEDCIAPILDFDRQDAS